MGIDAALPAKGGAQRQREALRAGASIEEVFAAEVETTRSTYSAQEVTT
jgi:carboxylate-amine ligase